MDWKKFVAYANQIGYLSIFGWKYQMYNSDKIEFRHDKYGSVVVENEKQLHNFLIVFSAETVKNDN